MTLPAAASHLQGWEDEERLWQASLSESDPFERYAAMRKAVKESA